MWKTEERIRQDVERLYKGTSSCLSGCCEMEAYELNLLPLELRLVFVTASK